MNLIRTLRTFPQARDYIDFNLRQRNQWVESVAKELPPETRILDVGAGPGLYKPLFAHCQYEAQDFAQYEGNKSGLMKDSDYWFYGKLDYISDITAIPVPDSSFDAILCTEVLEHVPEPILALKEMSRILKSGGVMYLSAPLASGLHQLPYHFYGGYTPQFYQKFLAEFGMNIDYIRPNGGFFKHFLQESARAGSIISSRRKWGRFSIKRLLIGLVFQRLIPIFFYHFDDDLFVEEFTVGYFVKATKR